MKWFNNLFYTVKSFFGKLFGSDGDGFIRLIEKISPLVNKAYPIVKTVARLTPNKTDDEILKAYEKLGFSDVFDATKPKALSLRDLSKSILVASNPDPVSEYLANTAIELAYAKFKEEQK